MWILEVCFCRDKIISVTLIRGLGRFEQKSRKNIRPNSARVKQVKTYVRMHKRVRPKVGPGFSEIWLWNKHNFILNFFKK